jgi:hypothetical protein
MTASDPDGDALSYSATGLPTGLGINASTGLISGTPTVLGTSSAVVTVTDGRGGSATASFSWTVQVPVNRPPVIATPAAQSTTQNQAVSLAMTASDPDGDTLSYSATGLPTGLGINASSGLISGTPTVLGTSSTVVTVTDGRGGSATASFSWTVTSSVPAILSGTVLTTPTAANLTTVGTGDWAHWGDGGGVPGLVRKASGGSQISAYSTLLGGGAISYGDDLRALSWSDGTPTVSSTSNTNGIWIGGVGNGFSVTVPAGTTSRTVTLYVGGWNSSGTLRAHLSDASAADFTDTTSASSGQYVRTYTITYRAATAGKQLVLTWAQAAGVGNVTLNGVALTP